jgi:hypothetical protein
MTDNRFFMAFSFHILRKNYYLCSGKGNDDEERIIVIWFDDVCRVECGGTETVDAAGVSRLRDGKQYHPEEEATATAECDGRTERSEGRTVAFRLCINKPERGLPAMERLWHIYRYQRGGEHNG